jgi:hypothetical protein
MFTTTNKKDSPNRFRFLITILTFLFSFISANAVIRYVKPVASGTGDGLSWANASGDLQVTISLSSAADQIWVAAGTYKPTLSESGVTNPADSRRKTFSLKEFVPIYGGFLGNETNLSDRNWGSNQTILSGDLTGNDSVTGNMPSFTLNNRSDNVYHVVSNYSKEFIYLDGFIIKGGNANGTVSYSNVQPLYTFSSTDQILLRNDRGAGFNSIMADQRITNCVFTENYALLEGSAFRVSAFDPNRGQGSILNTVFTGNSSPDSTISINLNNSIFSLGQVTIANNIGYGIGVISSNTNFELFGNIEYNNTSLSNISFSFTSQYSNIQKASGVYAGVGMINANPNFQDINNPIGPDNKWMTADDGLQLDCNSPCFNSTNFTSATNDILGTATPQFGTKDMGAYESKINQITRIYVDGSLAISGDGSSWANASNNLQDAINRPCVQEVWVKSGTYYPTLDVNGNAPANSRKKTFTMKSGVSVYGGFIGTETALSQRNFKINQTILSGDIGVQNNKFDNAYHVVLALGLSTTTTIDGFLIKSGYANLNTLANDIYDESGAGIFVNNSSDKFTIENCIITENECSSAFSINGGGGIYNRLSTLNINSCVISNNIASTFGGGLKNQTAYFIAKNSIFLNNTANTGGAIQNELTDYEIYNSTIYGNNGANGGAISNNSSLDSFITNSVIFGNSNPSFENFNTTVSYSNVQGGVSGTGNINVNPQFQNSTNPIGTDGIWATPDDGLLLLCSSPSVNSGTNNPPTPNIDITGTTRPLTGSNPADMGAYETNFAYPILTTSLTKLFVKKGSNGLGSSWSDSLGELSIALKLANTNPSVTEIWVAAGTYYPEFDQNVLGCPADNRAKVFIFKDGLSMYGGFAGIETVLSQRNITANPTILSGDLGVLNNDSDNAYHVIAGRNINTSGVFNGFTVQDGNANVVGTFFGFNINDNGGGMIVYNSSGNIDISECIFKNNKANRGGAMNLTATNNTIVSKSIFENNSSYNIGGSSGGGAVRCSSGSPDFIDVIFRNNTANLGGAVYNVIASATYKNSIFQNNTASSGAGIYFDGAGTSSIINSVFTNNTASNVGGAMAVVGATANIINSTIYNNQASATTSLGGGIFFGSTGTGTVTNSILYNNTTPNNTANAGREEIYSINTPPFNATINYSIIRDALPILNTTDGGNNSSVNPTFINPTNPIGADNIWATTDDGLQLACGSPAFDSGTATGAPTTDILNIARPQGSFIDLGAYESTVLPNAIVFVDNSVAVSGTGLSWASPFKTIQEGINYCSVTQVWVKSGTYYPTLDPSGNVPINPRDKTFAVKDGVKIYGGFAGTETLLSERNWGSNQTILSGDIGTIGTNTDNCYHVVFADGVNNQSLVNGFIIQDGFGTDATTLNRYLGAGIYNDARTANSQPNFENCVIRNNTNRYGAAVFNEGRHPTNLSKITLTNCVILGNSTDGYSDGAAFSNYGNVVANSEIVAVNCTITQNINQFEAVVYNNSGSRNTLTNCIVWDNSGAANVSVLPTGLSITYSCIEGSTVYSGTGNINTNPNFINNANPIGADNLWMTADDGLRLSCASPAYNTGTTINTLTNDILNIPRPQNSNFDIGAYETLIAVTPSSTTLTRLYVKKSILTGLQNGSSWANAFSELSQALRVAHTSNTVTEIWVTAGTYLPNYDVSFSSCLNDPREKTFLMKRGVSIYGGFVGNETSFLDRDYIVNETILSGDINNNDLITDNNGNLTFANNNDNIYHVVVSNNPTLDTRLNGITISGGYANKPGNSNFLSLTPAEAFGSMGAGIFACKGTNKLFIENCRIKNCFADILGGGIFNYSASPFITNCEFSFNKILYSGGLNRGGGAIYNAQSASPNISKCIIKNNQSRNGAGIYNFTNSNPVIANTVIVYNKADDGAGIYNFSSNPLITNSLIAYNQASTSSSVMYNDNSDPIITNCSMIKNTNSAGSTIFLSNGSIPVMKNSIVWGNTASIILNGFSQSMLKNCNLQVSFPHTGSQSNNPNFVDINNPLGPDGVWLTADDGLQLQSTSPNINASDATTITPSTDIIGYSRNGVFDIGAYEYINPGTCPNFTTTWDGLKWSNGLPNSSTKIIFDGNRIISNNLYGCSCQVNSGKNISVTNNANVSLLNNLDVLGTATMTFANNTSLLQKNSTIANTGNILYNRLTTPYEKFDYEYWSTPVSNPAMTLPVLNVPFANWRLNSAYKYSPENYNDDLLNDGYDDTGDDWSAITPTTVLEPAKGYAIMAPTASVVFAPNATANVTFDGIPNNGDIAIPLVLSNGVYPNGNYNLIGNPYPSAIDADNFINSNLANISGSLYFWTHVGDLSAANPGIFPANYNSDDYAIYNLLGGVGTRAALTAGATTIPNGKIASGQGFFVKASANNPAVFNNSMRILGSNNQFFRSQNPIVANDNSFDESPISKNRLWLNLENNLGVFSQQLIGYVPETSLDFDKGYDGLYSKTSNYINFYSYLNNQDSDLYKIQSRGIFQDSDVIKLGYFSSVAGDFKISIDQAEGILNDESTNIYVQDNLTNTIHNLKTSDYNFTTSVGDFNDRFLLRYTNANLANTNFELNVNDLIVYKNDQNINIISTKTDLKEVQIFDIRGRLIAENKRLLAPEGGTRKVSVDNLNIAQQILIVKVKTIDNKIISKKIVF